jgi:hypothetical protein
MSSKMLSLSRVECSPVTKRSEAHEQRASYGSDIVSRVCDGFVRGRFRRRRKIGAECRMEYRRQFQRGGGDFGGGFIKSPGWPL